MSVHDRLGCGNQVCERRRLFVPGALPSYLHGFLVVVRSCHRAKTATRYVVNLVFWQPRNRMRFVHRPLTRVSGLTILVHCSSAQTGCTAK
eukprot:SAG31_NODE_7850_length_1583_cov_1.460916_3_plen_90_part_01